MYVVVYSTNDSVSDETVVQVSELTGPCLAAKISYKCVDGFTILFTGVENVTLMGDIFLW